MMQEQAVRIATRDGKRPNERDLGSVQLGRGLAAPLEFAFSYEHELTRWGCHVCQLRKLRLREGSRAGWFWVIRTAETASVVRIASARRGPGHAEVSAGAHIGARRRTHETALALEGTPGSGLRTHPPRSHCLAR